MKYPIGLEEVKSYLRVDFPDDDMLLTLIIDAGKQYIVDAVGKFDDNNPKHNMVLLAVCAQLYENRILQGQSSGKITRIINSILLQEHLNGYGGDDSEN